MAWGHRCVVWVPLSAGRVDSVSSPNIKLLSSPRRLETTDGNIVRPPWTSLSWSAIRKLCLFKKILHRGLNSNSTVEINFQLLERIRSVVRTKADRNCVFTESVYEPLGENLFAGLSAPNVHLFQVQQLFKYFLSKLYLFVKLDTIKRFRHSPFMNVESCDGQTFWFWRERPGWRRLEWLCNCFVSFFGGERRWILFCPSFGFGPSQE